VRSRKPVLVTLALLALGPVVVGSLPTAAGAPGTAARALAGPDSGTFPGAEVALGDADRRGPRLAPLTGALSAVRAMGKDVRASWTQYGTVLSLTRDGGFLARAVPGGTPERVAREYLRRNAGLFGLAAADVDQLELLSATDLSESTVAHVVQLRQRAGGHLVAEDGLLSVGMRGSDIAIVTSSAVPAATLRRLNRTEPVLDELAAVVAAARDAGVTGLALPDVRYTGKTDGAGFALLSAKGLAQEQRARLRTLATTDRGTRLVWEVDVLDVAGPKALATISFVDAVDGSVLLRRDAVDTLADGTRSSAATRSITTQAPPLPSGLVSPASTVLGPATWRAFSSNPQFPFTDKASKDDRDKICATSHTDKTDKAQGCNKNGFTYFDASPFAYDVDAITGLPTFTTVGNNALTSNAQGSTSLTPGGPFLPPVGPTRDYAPAFTDSWHATKCDPTTIANPADRANVDAAIVNLFVGHNRIHDFAYRLGLTEKRGAMQVTNFGKGGAEGDPELGNAQNAALTNGVVEGGGLTGRNNANQITLQDGVPGITNQYLFQPVLGFYSPCTDGDLDGTIFLHEYTHAVSNRLIAGPDTGLSGTQGGSMGESWSDLVAVEYLNAFGLAGKRGEDPFALGAYATGDTYRGIRDFNLRDNPLTFADFGFDSTGPEVHADGEIWNGVQIGVRNDLVKKWDKTYSSKNLTLQASCALGRTAAGKKHSTFAGCPGNRRWITYVFDSMILQANGSPSMVDMKNAQLAADLMRGGGDQRAMAAGFARRGLGADAETTSGDTDPTPSFATAAKFGKDNGRVTFVPVDATTGKKVKADVFVGQFQARVTPVASTDPETEVSNRAAMISGKYELVVSGRGYGIQRFKLDVPAGRSITKRLALLPNLASVNRGAIIRATPGWVRLRDVIDDDEATNSGFEGLAFNRGPTDRAEDDTVSGRTSIVGKSFTVTLAGGKQRVARIALSALHRPAKAPKPDQPADFQGRLLGLHDFDVQASSDGGKTFKTVYRSPKSFFPTGAPRAVAPDLNLRTVKLPKAVVADHLRVVVRSNTCTGTADFRGDRDNDPANNSDCPSTDNAYRVTVTEFQAFGR
jgi:extracellular elastinolytic metalloproteinase